MTINAAEIDLGSIKATTTFGAARACLRRKSDFLSDRLFERTCPYLKGTVAWRSTDHEGGGQGRRRSRDRLSSV